MLLSSGQSTGKVSKRSEVTANLKDNWIIIILEDFVLNFMAIKLNWVNKVRG